MNNSPTQSRDSKYENYVFGNSLASLVAVFELKKAKKNFFWIQDGPRVEGIWRGYDHKERILDLGMINFELDVRHPAASEDLISYDQYAINDCARFSNYVSEFVKVFTDIKELPAIKVYENSDLYRDHLISNNFADLSRFAKFRTSPTSLPIENHPSLKYTKGGRQALLNISYYDYVTKYFGENLAGPIFLNWARKLVGDNVKIANTYRHRAAWLPLPYPETINASLEGANDSDLSYKFHYPESVTFSEMANRIFIELEADTGGHRTQFTEIGALNVKTLLESGSRFFWGGKMETFLNTINRDDIFPLTGYRNLVDIDIYEGKLSDSFESYVILNNDIEDDDWYRITVVPNVNLENGCRIIVVESKNSKIGSHQTKNFEKFGIVITDHIKGLSGIPVFLTLNGEQYQDYEAWHSTLVSTFPSIDFGGGSSFAYSATFSDQVIQGHKFARKVSDSVI